MSAPDTLTCETHMRLAGARMVETERAWEAELDARFGAAAGTIRYLPEGEGVPGTRLAALFARRLQALKTFETLKQAWRRGARA